MAEWDRRVAILKQLCERTLSQSSEVLKHRALCVHSGTMTSPRLRTARFSPRSPSVVVTAVALVLAALATTPGAAVATAVKPCKEMGPLVTINRLAVPSCKTLYSSGAAIRLPKDSRTVKYGVLDTLTTATFIDRAGQRLTVTTKLTPKEPTIGAGGMKSYSQVVYQASLRNDKITKVTPALFVSTKTVLRPYLNQSFIGELTNLLPDADVPATDFVRMDFGASFTSEGALSGSFTNLVNSVRRSQLLEPPAPCEPALLGVDSARDAWYAKIFGTSPAVTLAWDPAMHGPQDSELVIYVGGGISYMTHSPTLLELMKGNLGIRAQKQFTIHGNPMGTPASFTGSFAPTYPLRTCTPPTP